MRTLVPLYRGACAVVARSTRSSPRSRVSTAPSRLRAARRWTRRTTGRGRGSRGGDGARRDTRRGGRLPGVDRTDAALRLQDSNPDLTAPKAVVLPLHQGGTHRTGWSPSGARPSSHGPGAGRARPVRPRWRDAAAGRGRPDRRGVGSGAGRPGLRAARGPVPRRPARPAPRPRTTGRVRRERRRAVGVRRAVGAAACRRTVRAQPEGAAAADPGVERDDDEPGRPARGTRAREPADGPAGRSGHPRVPHGERSRAVDAAIADLLQAERAILSGVSEDEQAQLSGLLRRLILGLGD